MEIIKFYEFEDIIIMVLKTESCYEYYVRDIYDVYAFRFVFGMSDLKDQEFFETLYENEYFAPFFEEE